MIIFLSMSDDSSFGTAKIPKSVLSVFHSRSCTFFVHFNDRSSSIAKIAELTRSISIVAHIDSLLTLDYRSSGIA